MMKRIVSLFLCLVLLISAVPVQAFAAGQDGGDIVLGEYELPPIPLEPDEEKEEFVVSEQAVTLGENQLTLDPGAENTLFVFEAEEKAIYRFSVNKGTAGYWGSPWFPVKPADTAASFEMECWYGPGFCIGIAGQGSCTLTITKVGEAKPDRQYITYDVQETPDAKKMACYTVDGTGDQLVVNFAASTGVNLNDVIGGPGNIVVLAENDYDYIDYRPALEAYSAAAKGAGNYYLLTDDLAKILTDLYNYENSSWSSLMESIEGLYEKASINHTPGEAVEEDGFLNTYCANCAALISSEEITGCAHKELVHVEAKEATCYENGTQEYWYCNGCESAWSDEALTQITNHKNVIIPAGHTDLVHVEAKEATCCENGNQEYWYCNGCEGAWSDEALTQITNHKNVIIPATGDHPLGSGENPETLTMGEHSFTIVNNNRPGVMGRYYTWTAPADGTLTINLTCQAWCYQVYNWTKEEIGNLIFSTDGTGNPIVMEVSQGDKIEFRADCYDPADPTSSPSNGTVTFTAAFAEKQPEDDGIIASGKTEDLTWKLSEEGVLTLSGVGYSGSYTDTDAPWAGYAQQITSIVVEEGASVLGDHLFDGLSQVTTVSLPDSLSGIGAATFSGCSSLKSVHIPAKVDTVFYWAFAYCDSLTEFTVDPANPWFFAEDGVLCYEFDGGEQMVVAYPGGKSGSSYTVPDKVVQLAPGAFKGNKNLKEVTLPQGMRNILMDVFADSNLETITLSESVVYIDLNAFGNCAKLKSVTFLGDAPYIEHNVFDGTTTICYYPADNESWTEDMLQDYSGDITWVPVCGHEKLVHVEAKEATCYENGTQEYWYCSVCESAWADEALTQITNHKNVIIPAGHTDLVHVEAKEATATENGNIEHWYCNGCETVWQDEALTQITNHKNVIIPMIVDDGIIASGSCGENAVWTLTADGVLTISGTGAMDNYTFETPAPWAEYSEQILKVVVEEGITTIGDMAFRQYSNLTSVTIPDSVASIGNNAFCFCSNLTEVVIPDSVTSIGHQAFAFSGLTEVIVPNGLTTLEPAVFASCPNLTKVVISDSVITLDFESFCASPLLTEVTFGENVTIIGGEVFSFCKSLTEVVIPESVTTIEASAFFFCENLTSVKVPAGVTTIGQGAFLNCPNLTLTVVEGSVAEQYAVDNEIPYVYAVEEPGTSAENPIFVEFEMNEEWTAGTATLTVEPGTWYYGAYMNGMILTANGEEVAFSAADRGMPNIFSITNGGTEAAAYELAISFPVGTMENPAQLVLGENAAQIEAGNSMGYYFTWTAPAKGELTVTMPEGNWLYTINNLTTYVYGETQWSDSDPVVNPAVVKVGEGDLIQVMVNTYDPADMWNNPAGTLAVQAAFKAAQIAPLTLIPMVGEPAEVVQLDDGSYIVYLDKEDVADEKIQFSVMIDAYDKEGNPLDVAVKDLKWSTSDKRVATVVSDKYMPIGNVTVVAKAEGACVITAVNSKTKDEASVAIHVRDYAPRLGATSLTMNSNLTAGVDVSLVESYGNAVEGFLSLHDYNSKTKAYSEEPSVAFYPEYVDGVLTINNMAAMKNGTYKLLLKVPCANGQTYEYKISVKVSNKLPTVTVKQLGKFNTFYTDSVAQFQITAKDEQILDVAFETASFVSDFDAETGILTVRYSEDYLANGGKRVTKGNFEVFFEGYFVPAKKSVTVSTEKKVPKLALSMPSTTFYTSVSDDLSTSFYVYKPENMDVVETSFITVQQVNFADIETTGETVMVTLKEVGGKIKGGTLNITVKEDNWSDSVKLTHKITVNTKKPAMKLEYSSIKLNSVFTDRYAYQYMYLTNTNLSADYLKVEPTSTKASVLAETDKIWMEPEGSDAIFICMDQENLPKKGTYEFKATAYLGSGEEGDVVLGSKTFKVVVEDKVPAVTLKSTTLKLNKKLGTNAYAETAVTLPKTAVDYKLIGFETAANDNVALTFEPETGILKAELLNAEATAGKQALKLYPVIEDLITGQTVTLNKAVTLNVQVYEGKPSVTVKASGKLDTIVPSSAITYTISKLTNITGEPTDVRLEGTGAELFNVRLVEGKAVVTLKYGETYKKDASYKLKLVYTISGQEVPASVTLKVTQSAVKFAAVKTMNLYQSNNRLACTLVMTAPAGASIGDISLSSKSAKQFLNAVGAEGLSWAQFEDGSILVTFKINNPAYLTYGKNYTVYLDVTPAGNAENVKPTQVKLTVKTFK